MTEISDVINGGHSCFKIVGVVDPLPTSSLVSTLVEWLDDHTPEDQRDLVVKTGSQFGPYATTLRVLSEPTSVNGDWEDVVETSVQCDSAIGLSDLIDGPSRWLRMDPGAYRMRVSSHGRTESSLRDKQQLVDDEADEDPLENFLIELWPAPIVESVVVRENSQFAREVLNPPLPIYPSERELGYPAALRVAADLQDPAGGRLSGELGEVAVMLEVDRTPTQAFNRVKHANGWPPSNGGGLSLNEKVGDRCIHYGDRPNSAVLQPLLGRIHTEVIAFDKPRRFAMTWNWSIEDGVGDVHKSLRYLLVADSVVQMTFVKRNRQEQPPRTLVTINHTGVPAEWVDDLKALWTWDVAIYMQ